MESIGNGTAEDAIGLTVQGLQGTGTHIHRYISCHEQILIEDKFDLLVGLVIAFDQTGAGVELQAAAASDIQLRIDAAPGGSGFVDFLVSQGA